MLSIVIQAGGDSRRMGQDKGLVKFLGVPISQRLVKRLKPLADEIILTTNHPEDYAFLEARLVKDRYVGRGALGGLYTALWAARYAHVAVVACDMPFASPTLLAKELEILKLNRWDAVIPKMDTGIEPFHSVFLRRTCLPAVLRAIQQDKWRVDAWFDQVKTGYILPDEVRQVDPQELAFLNINTIQELISAEAQAIAMGEQA
jgi:molybdopterin-guanine dinucleotide biosynthesis protein A